MSCRHFLCRNARDHSHSSRSRGFTLVELAVVLAVLVFLLAMLVPLCRRMRTAAAQAECTANLQQIGVLVRLYADKFDGAIPVGTVSTDPSTSYCLYRSLSKAGDYCSLGLLVPAKILPSEPKDECKVLYCPVTDMGPSMAFDSDANRWIGIGENKGETTRMTYSQRPEYTYYDEQGAAQQPYPSRRWNIQTNPVDWQHATYQRINKDASAAFPKLKDFTGKDKSALVADLLVKADHLKASHKTGVNVLFADWSVKWVPYDYFKKHFEQLKADEDTGVTGTALTRMTRITYWRLWESLDKF